MASDRADMIRLLEAELDLIEGGGYGESPREPRKSRPMFKDSIACIQHWFVPGQEADCHDGCVLMPFVPEKHKQEGLPCHFIPLDESGVTITALEQEGDQEQLQEAVKQWLRTTIERLKQEQARLEQEGRPDTFEVPY
jgi:hypothetical protein